MAFTTDHAHHVWLKVLKKQKAGFSHPLTSMPKVYYHNIYNIYA